MTLISRIKHAYAALAGEATGPQLAANARGVAGFASALPGYAAVAPGTFDTYRAMRGNPTLAIARAAATAPIKAAPVAFEGDAGDEQLGFIRATVGPMWPFLVREALWALDYGFKAFEKVYAVEDGYLVLKKLKPLRVDDVRPLADPATGRFAGLRQGKVTLPAEKAWWHAVDGEDGDLYGRSRHENVRRVWSAWNDLMVKEGQYATKTAGIIPIIRYPEGQSPDRAGVMRSHFELAEMVAANLGRGNGVTMPNTLSSYAHDLIASGGVDASSILAWQISFLEERNSHFGGLLDSMRHKESLMLRGWLVPERAVAEGRFGTRADADAHADLALAVADEVLRDLLRSVNWYVIDPLLALNFGEAARGRVRVNAAPLTDDKAALVRGIVEKVLTQPTSAGLLKESLDWDAMVAGAGLPVTTTARAAADV